MKATGQEIVMKSNVGVVAFTLLEILVSLTLVSLLLVLTFRVGSKVIMARLR